MDKKVYAIQYVLFKFVDGKQEIIDVRIQGVYSKFDGTGSAVEAMRNIAKVYDLYVPSGADEIAIFGNSACYSVSFDKNGNPIDSYYDRNVAEKMKVRKLWYTVPFDMEE